MLAQRLRRVDRGELEHDVDRTRATELERTEASRMPPTGSPTAAGSVRSRNLRTATPRSCTFLLILMDRSYP
jgi:hypothetical protein